MAIDTLSPRSRRSLMTGVIGGLAAAAASTLAGAQRVLAGTSDGTAVVVGDSYFDVGTETYLQNVTTEKSVLALYSAGGAPTLRVQNDHLVGVAIRGEVGSSTGTGIHGKASGGGTGVYGVSGDAPSAVPAQTGVFGSAPAGRGVLASGGKAQLRLVPSKALHPHSGQVGDLFLDKNKRLWLCKGGTAWHQIA